jgi:hydroxymethylpyrimidine/phosphomethylpyrimidine kinase
MSKAPTITVALTIAGSDSGGGAGIQADLKTFAALGVHGTSVITCVTAQNPARVSGMQACSPRIVRQQIESVWEGFHPVAVKTGMLYSAAIIRAVVESLGKIKGLQLVVDPVMVATSGAALLEPAAVKMLTRNLLPLAMLVTPNLDEAAKLVGRPLRTVEDMRAAAREIKRMFGCAALVKGGHLKGVRSAECGARSFSEIPHSELRTPNLKAVDIFHDGREELFLSAPFIKGVRTHGTGCTYSAAITAHLALGCDLPTAVTRAKEQVTQAIAHYQNAGGHAVLNNFWLRPYKSP